jgi:hypothetical protein
MLLNNDLLFVVGSFIVGGIFTYSFYNNIFTTVNKGESLVNTIPNIDSINLAESAYPVLQPNVLHKIDVGVQTEATVQVADASVQATNTYVNTGIQTEARMWYETVKNWIMELLSMRDSELQGITPTEVRVENWINNLDNTQLVSQNSMNSVISNTPINNLINVGESVSNVEESILLEYAQSQTNFDIGSRAEYFNIISPQVDVTLENVMVNDTQYLFAVVKDVILTLDPNIFNFFM